jgi:anti-sigma regulatory factor (Ser/Thr protein kinase)
VIASDTLTIASRTTAIDEARRWVAGHLAPAGASADLVWEVEMALTEALANVITHGYRGDDSQLIHLSLQLHADHLEIEIVDFAEPFDDSAYTPPDLTDARSGGYGVHLMRELMDEVERTAIPDGGTRLRLVKRRWREDR